jgi:uncharacterized protein (TIGR04255 family)
MQNGELGTEARAMSTGQPLPKYRRPPLIEVVHGVQFQRLPMTIVHPGEFYPRVKVEYPRVQTVASLPPIREIFDVGPAQPQIAFQFAQGDDLPRAWFVSSDDTMLIQLQPNRLLLNWRRGTAAAEYPHFDKVSAEFQRVYHQLEGFVAQTGLGVIKPDQCEMTYINHMVPGEDASAISPGHLFRIWTDNLGPEWQMLPDDVAFSTRYILRDHNGEAHGRLSVSLVVLRGLPVMDGTLQLELTVRGKPGTETFNDVIAFHQMAHEHIVRCFTGITTEAAHRQWERFQ